jgi:anti-sigma-K factor RskA
MNVDEFAELAAGHALHALSTEDQQTYDAALAAHPEWAAIADADASTAAELADGVTEVAPPAHVRGALLATIAAASRVDAEPAADAPTTTGEPPPNTEAIQTVSRRQWTRGLLALAASLVLLVALGTGVAMIGDRLYEPAAVVALNEIESAPDAQNISAQVEGGGHATLQWSDEVGKAVVVTEGVAELDSDQSYEMWFARDGVMVSAGVFTTNADGSATALLNAPIQEGDDAVAITIEEEGGSPTGQPTTDPITTLPTA